MINSPHAAKHRIGLTHPVTAAKRGQVLALPAGKTELTAQYTLGDAEMSLVRQPRGDANKLGFAIQLCLLRYPGIALADDTEVPPELGSDQYWNGGSR